MFTEQELICLPGLTVAIPLGHNATACVMHLLRNQVSDIKISLEDLRAEGATLLLSGHIRPYPSEDMETPEEQDKMKYLREFWEDYMKEQKHKLGLDNPLTLEQIQRNLELIELEKIKFADEDCWSEDTVEYCERFENEIFADGLFDSIDVWGKDEDND